MRSVESTITAIFTLGLLAFSSSANALTVSRIKAASADNNHVAIISCAEKGINYVLTTTQDGHDGHDVCGKPTEIKQLDLGAIEISTVLDGGYRTVSLYSKKTLSGSGTSPDFSRYLFMSEDRLFSIQFDASAGDVDAYQETSKCLHMIKAGFKTEMTLHYVGTSKRVSCR